MVGQGLSTSRVFVSFFGETFLVVELPLQKVILNSIVGQGSNYDPSQLAKTLLKVFLN